MATRYGRTFTTRKGRTGRYKYVNGRKVSFEVKRRHNRKMPQYRSKSKYWGAKTYARKQRSFTRRLRGY